MNIQFQLCGLSILILLIIFYNSHKTLHLYKERVFNAVLWIITISLSEDILSLVAIDYRDVLPVFLVELICKLYLSSLVLGAWSALIYVFTDVRSEKEHVRLTWWMILPVTVQRIVILLLPVYIYANEGKVYTYGPSVTIVYIFVAIYILSTLIVTFVLRKKLNPRIRFAIVLWMLIWIASAVAQFLNDGLLIVGFASAIGVLILAVIIENPEANLERKLGCFNSYALTEYLNQLFERKKSFSIMEISFENTILLEEMGMDIDEILRRILRLLSRYNDIFVFKNINLSLILISENREELESAAKAILDDTGHSEIYRKTAMLIIMEHTDDFSDMDNLMRFFSFVRSEREEEKGVLIFTDESMVTRFKQKNLIEQEISDALAEDRVEVFLQPIYSNGEKYFTSAEALVRIRERNGSIMPPGLFIPVAEDSGQILELGERVFEKVCHFLHHTEVLQLGLHYIEVNLSVVQCEKIDLAERLISIANTYEIDPRWINLEITETGSIRARQTLLENMKKLIEHGFSFSLDDFGKGESNLMYVVEMPVCIVKLDHDMSKAFFCSDKAKHVVRAVISMAHGMNLKVVAEGIETETEAGEMYVEGIDYIQGYYYARPLPVREFLEFLRKNAVQA